ncbi:hypothetical protein LTR56_019689 [Elasticomyces elasticus]|nr:hypothetical protein LTR56_019689 [Elasticomyces elasticus]KAK3633990.1 hypothetical protein LTR22_019857 [Elasticomyces elasticus]KAK4911115.1 hypothetical protein LTR49_020282 [Elasticomyces elasticus]KAK5750657.1 hypothetical protein LTS12_019278 [Elasticomyces elasticus]
MDVKSRAVLARLRDALEEARREQRNTSTAGFGAATEILRQKLEPSVPNVLAIILANNTPQSLQKMLADQRNRSNETDNRTEADVAYIRDLHLQRLADLLGAVACFGTRSANNDMLLAKMQDRQIVRQSSTSSATSYNVTFKECINDPNSTPLMPKWQGEPHQFLASTGDEIRSIEDSRRGVAGFRTVARKLVHTSKDAREWLSMEKFNVGSIPATNGGSAGLAGDDLVDSSPDLTTTRTLDDQSFEVDSPAQIKIAAVTRRIQLMELQAAVDIETAESRRQVARRLRLQKRAQTQGTPKKTRQQKTEEPCRSPRSTRSRAAQGRETTSTLDDELEADEEMPGSPCTEDRNSECEPESFEDMTARLLCKDDISQDLSDMMMVKPPSVSTRWNPPVPDADDLQSSGDEQPKRCLMVVIRLPSHELAKLETRAVAKRANKSSKDQDHLTLEACEQESHHTDILPGKGHGSETISAVAGRPKVILKLQPWGRKHEVFPESALRSTVKMGPADKKLDFSSL